MKAWHVLVAVVVLAQGFGWVQSCTALRAERKQHKDAWAAYRADSAGWAKRNNVLVDSLVTLRQDSARLGRNYAAAQRDAQTALNRLRKALGQPHDSQPGLAADLDTVVRASEACQLAWTNCEARAALETQRADEATAGRFRADSAAHDAHAQALQEMRHARAWKPFSMKPPGLVWAAGLLLAGAVLIK